MTDDTVGFRGFSCPQEVLDPSLFEIVATEYAQAVIDCFVSRFRAEIQRCGPGLLAQVKRAVDSPLPCDAVWDPLIGRMWRSVQRSEGNPSGSHAAELALRMHEAGESGEWTAEFPEPVRLRCGALRLPPCERISVTCADGVASIATSAGTLRQEISLRLQGGRWEAVGVDALPVVDDHGCRVVILDDVGGWSAPPASFEPSKIPPLRIRDYLGQALVIVGDHAPDYLPWIARVLRYVAPVGPSLGQAISASDPDEPGVIVCSFPSSPIVVAEALVHEGSHQYFHLASRVGPLHDGSDTRLYLSPVKQEPRPLDKILLAYHAFANVLLLYRLARASGFRATNYLENAERQLRGEVAALEKPLRGNAALTDLGRDLWEPLAELIH